jgi:predicted DNA-binding protein
MPTTKKRTNLSLPNDLNDALESLSERDNVSKSAKAMQLIEIGLSLEEDEIWNRLAEDRDKKGAKFVSHEDLWK